MSPSPKRKGTQCPHVRVSACLRASRHSSRWTATVLDKIKHSQQCAPDKSHIYAPVSKQRQTHRRSPMCLDRLKVHVRSSAEANALPTTHLAMHMFTACSLLLHAPLQHGREQPHDACGAAKILHGQESGTNGDAKVRKAHCHQPAPTRQLPSPVTIYRLNYAMLHGKISYFKYDDGQSRPRSTRNTQLTQSTSASTTGFYHVLSCIQEFSALACNARPVTEA